MRLTLLATLAAVLTLPGLACADMTVNPGALSVAIRNPDGTPNASSVVAAYDFSGIGTDPLSAAGGNGFWATLIAPNVILTSSHSWPAYAADGNATPISFTNAAGQTFTYFGTNITRAIGGSDLAVMTLNQPVDPSLTIYPLAPATQGPGTPSIGVGRPFTASLDPVATVSTFLGEGSYLTWNYSATTPYSSYLDAGDSGGPTFAIEPGNGLAVMGIHLGVDKGVFSEDSYAGAGFGLLGEIDAAMTAMGSPYQASVWTGPPTPEPGSLALIGVGLAGWLAVRWRRRD